MTPGDAQAALTWSPVSGAVNYNVYRSISLGTLGSLVASPVAASFTDTAVANGTMYYYSVSAVNSHGESTPSEQKSATPQVPVPGVPTGLTASAGNGQVTLTWTVVGGAVGYNVYRSTSSGMRGPLLASPTNAAFIDGSVVNGTTYFYRVTATNVGGESALSLPQSANPQAPPPVAPANLIATAGNGEVTLTWGPVSGATGYKVYRSEAPDGSGALLATATSSFYTDTAVTNGTTYYYRITAVGAGGESSPSTTQSAMPQVPVPGAPAGLTATAGDAVVSLTWGGVSGVSTYVVYRSTTTVDAASPIASLSTLSFSDTDVTNGITYHYWVAAANEGGESVWGGPSSATPQVSAPATPTGLGAVTGDGTVTLAWTPVSQVVSYKLYRSTVSGDLGSVIAVPTSADYTDAAVTIGTTYFYRVSAVNAGGESSASLPLSVTPAMSAGGTVTLPNAPLNYDVTVMGSLLVTFGSSESYSSTYTGTAVAYQWYLNGTPLAGKTSSTLVFSPRHWIEPGGESVLSLAVTDANGVTYVGSLVITIQ